jgi:hypothetical protein
VEGLHIVGGVTPVENISINDVLHLCVCYACLCYCLKVIMYFVAYMNYCLLHLNLYRSSNSVLCVLFRLQCMLDISMYVCISAW